MQVTQPTRVERAFVVLAQGIYLSFYSFTYFFAPRAAHRLTGYLGTQRKESTRRTIPHPVSIVH